MGLLRFAVLVVLLNVVRYMVAPLLEGPLIFPDLFGAMEASADYFKTEFGRWDWITSYAYNFAMWTVSVWLFHLLEGDGPLGGASPLGVTPTPCRTGPGEAD